MSRTARATAVLALVLLVGCRGDRVPPAAAPGQSPQAARIANLHAFARLYGVLRWFHPSDAAAAVDWDRFAVQGVKRVANAPDGKALRSELARLIGPIAPTVQLAAADERFAAAPPPPAGKTVELVAWEHESYGDNTLSGTYASKRRHRPRSAIAPGAPFYALSQTVDAAPLHGARLRLRGKVRTANHGLGRIWLRVDRGGQRGFFDNMNDRPVTSVGWTTAEIVGDVAPDATQIAFGAVMSGGGTVWYDDLELAREMPDGSWSPIQIRNAGFESEDVLHDWTPGTAAPGAPPASFEGWHAARDVQDHAVGAASWRVEHETRLVTDELFADAPGPSESVDIDLAPGLRARVPIALPSVEGHTPGDDPAAARRLLDADPAGAPDRFDAMWGLADVIVVWNVLEHFWPYWDTVPVDWNAELDRALADALDDRSIDDHVQTLERLSAAAPDGHAETRCPGQARTVRPPFDVDLVEGQVVVTASADPALAVGDAILTIDGAPATERLAAEAALVSGSKQWRLVGARRHLGSGPAGASLSLTVRRAGRDQPVTVVRTGRTASDSSHPPLERLDDGVYYVDLRRIALREIDENLDKLAAAPGIVFDVRGYPSGNHDVLSHLLPGPVNLSAGMAIPHVIRPDHVAAWATSWRTESFEMQARPPHFTGRVAFLTDARAYSYAESVMRLIEHYKLGEIVGAATAGTNGNMAEIAAPSGCRTSFTAMRVTRIDGRRSHLIGVQPTIAAAPTIAGLAAGRDEVLDKALAYVRTGAR